MVGRTITDDCPSVRTNSQNGMFIPDITKRYPKSDIFSRSNVVVIKSVSAVVTLVALSLKHKTSVFKFGAWDDVTAMNAKLLMSKDIEVMGT